MAVKSAGQDLRFAEIAREFNASKPLQLSNFYKDGPFVPSATQVGRSIEIGLEDGQMCRRRDARARGADLCTKFIIPPMVSFTITVPFIRKTTRDVLSWIRDEEGNPVPDPGDVRDKYVLAGGNGERQYLGRVTGRPEGVAFIYDVLDGQISDLTGSSDWIDLNQASIALLQPGAPILDELIYTPPHWGDRVATPANPSVSSTELHCNVVFTGSTGPAPATLGFIAAAPLDDTQFFCGFGAGSGWRYGAPYRTQAERLHMVLNENVPTTGELSFSNFYEARKEP